MVKQEALAPHPRPPRSPRWPRPRKPCWARGLVLVIRSHPRPASGLFALPSPPVLGVTSGPAERGVSADSLAEALFPPWLHIVFTGALLSAILSSVDSALLAVSAVATESGYRRIDPDASPRTMLRAARGATVIAGVIAALVAASGESLRDLVLDAGAIAAVLAVPIIMGLAGRGQGTHAALATIVVLGAVLGLCFDPLGLLRVISCVLWMIASG